MSGLILDLCGGTGSWSKPYLEAGYTVVKVTLPDHDVRTWTGYMQWGKNVHGVLAAPPCTEFSLAKNGQYRDFAAGLAVVDACLRIIHVARPKWWVLENPAGLLCHWLGRPKAYFHPWEYGDAWTKKTALWGDFQMPGKWFPVRPKGGLIKDLTRNAKKSDRAEIRSITPPGFARAFFEANP